MSSSGQLPGIDAQTAYYNSRWSGYGFGNALELQRCAAILDHLVATGFLRPRICDLGCGSGWLAGILGIFGETTGVDLSDVAARAASERFPHVHFEAANIFEWRHPLAYFDVVVSQEVLEHVEDQARYLQIANDLLKPGGYLIITTPNAKAFHAAPLAKQKAWSNQPIENWVDARQLRYLLSVCFRHIEITSIIPSFADSGFHRVANSFKVQRFLDAFGLGRPWRTLMYRCGYGLHLVALARKPAA
jgi:2-polyprenyl-3-methyl-5-hydroxy-6-metoxy-1,4-benzoquinol methylase